MAATPVHDAASLEPGTEYYVLVPGRVPNGWELDRMSKRVSCWYDYPACQTIFNSRGPQGWRRRLRMLAAPR